MLKKTERIKQILVLIATFGVIYINYLAGAGRINNTTPGDISDKYQTAITPAGYAFSIWSVIYLGLIAFSIYQALPSQADNARFARIRSLYIANCAANCLWIYLWHYDLIALSILAMLGILGTLILINLNLRDSRSAAEIWIAKVPFNLYFGWVSVATILNASIVLVFLGFQTPATLTAILAAVLFAVAAFLAFVIRRNFDFPFYALAIAWALTAIAVNQSSNPIIMTAAIIGAVFALLTAVFGKKKIN